MSDESVIEVAEEELEDIDLEDIEFDGRNIIEWEEHLTVQLPSLPCHSQEIAQAISDIGNKYQIAYNAYNKLLVLTNKAARAYRDECDKLVSLKVKDYETKKVRAPSKDTIEASVIGSSTKLARLKERFDVYDIIKQFFENSKNKLEKCMIAAKDISYSVNSSDRIYGRKGSEGDGL